MKSHMPQSLLACLGPWFQDLMILLETVVLDKKMDLPEQEPRLKTWKRVLQICCNLVSRHRKHVDKYDSVQLFTCAVYLLRPLHSHQESLLSARTECTCEVDFFRYLSPMGTTALTVVWRSTSAKVPTLFNKLQLFFLYY